MRPLCTAIVCPIISGTIVERRDHVLITFFSLREFSPSTFSCRWPSTNGPLRSERAMRFDSPRTSRGYSSTLRSLDHCGRRILRNPRTGPGTRCDTGQKGQTNRVPCAFGARSTITLQPGLHNRYNIGGCGAATARPTRTAALGFAAGRAGFTGRTRRAVLRTRGVRRELRRALRVAAIFHPPYPPRPGVSCSCQKFFRCYLRRCTITRSER